MMDEAFHLALYRGSSGEIITVEDYLALSQADQAAAAPDLAMVTASLVVDGEERLANILSLGPLNLLVPQLIPARERLQAGQFALIRSGVLDIPDGIYLLFEPSAIRAEVLASIVAFDDLPFSGYFPNEPRGIGLYDYVEKNKAALLEMSRQRDDFFVELPLKQNTLLEAFSREAFAGEQLLGKE